MLSVLTSCNGSKWLPLNDNGSMFQEMIEQHVSWNEDIGEWQLRCVAYTGNNMRKQTPQPDKDKEKVMTETLGCQQIPNQYQDIHTQYLKTI